MTPFGSSKDDKIFTDYLNISITGAISGDIIRGVQKCTKGATIRIYGDIYPIKKELDDIVANGMWRSFIDKLVEIPFFSSMKFKEREIWLKENQSLNECISLDPSPLFANILDIGESDIATRLTDMQIDTMMTSDKLSFSKIEDFFARNPARNEATGHTLFFLKKYWKITVDCNIVDSYIGITYDIERGICIDHIESDEEFEIIVVPNIVTDKNKKEEIAFYTKRDRMRFDDDVINELILDIYDTDIQTIDKIKSNFKGYTPAFYKSLIQKIIRYAPIKISLNDNLADIKIEELDAKLVLIVACCCLARHPGSFVPDIQRFVTGLESLTKRLGIIGGYEDSYIEESKIDNLLSLFSGALLSQRVRSWRPNATLFKRWLNSAIYFYEQKYACIYDIKAGSNIPRYYISGKLTTIEHCCALLEELKTFHNDIAMARYISKYYKTLRLTS